MTIVIGLTGLARSGKDTVADYLAEKYGYKVFVMSDILREELEKRKKESGASKMTLSVFGDELRREYGEDIVARLVWERAKHYDRVVVCGIRSPAEARFLALEADRFVLVRVDAPLETRWKRDPVLRHKPIEVFLERDELDESNKGLGEVLEMADLVLDNSGTRKQLYERVDRLVREQGLA